MKFTELCGKYVINNLIINPIGSDGNNLSEARPNQLALIVLDRHKFNDLNTVFNWLISL